MNGITYQSRSSRRAGGEELHDVGMLQPRRELDLALEPVAVDAGRHLGRQHLDDHAAAERGLFRQEDAAHAAAAELALDTVCGTDSRLESRGQFSQRVRPGWGSAGK